MRDLAIYRALLALIVAACSGGGNGAIDAGPGQAIDGSTSTDGSGPIVDAMPRPDVLPGEGNAIQFFGNGGTYADRVRIVIDDLGTTDTTTALDVGATDFTVEFWMKAAPGDNTNAITCADNNWVDSNTYIASAGISPTITVSVTGHHHDVAGDLSAEADSAGVCSRATLSAEGLDSKRRDASCGTSKTSVEPTNSKVIVPGTASDTFSQVPFSLHTSAVQSSSSKQSAGVQLGIPLGRSASSAPPVASRPGAASASVVETDPQP